MKILQSIVFLLIAWTKSTTSNLNQQTTFIPSEWNAKASIGPYNPSIRYSIFPKLSRIPVINETLNPVKHVMVVSSHRSGSTFTSMILQENWKTWFSFEPVNIRERYGNMTRIRGKTNESEAIGIMKGIHTCDYHSLESYLEEMYATREDFMHYNRFQFSLCRREPNSCRNPSFNREACLRSQYRVSKTVHLSLSTIEKILDQLNGSLNLTIIYLIRDPRASFNSRKSLSWCMETECGDYKLLCEDLKSDLDSYKRLVQRFGDQIIGLRHEDLSIDPLPRAWKLFNMTGIPYNNGTARFIRNISNRLIPDPNPRSVRRRSKQVPLKWIKDSQLNKTEVDDIQRHCAQVLEQVGYKPINFSPNMPISYEDIMEPNVTRLPNFIQ